MSILVYTENWNGKFKKSTFELVSYANEIAKMTGLETKAVSIGNVEESELKKLGKYGAVKVGSLESESYKDFSAQAYSHAIAENAKKENAKIIIFANNYSGRALAPRVTVKLDGSQASGVVALPSSTNPFIVKKKTFSGKAFADFELTSEIKVITLNQNTFELREDSKEIVIENIDIALPQGAYTAKPINIYVNNEKLSVTDAEILVSGGRGMKGPENWGMLEETADLLGAALCCSRPVTDLDWRPHHEHVGQTGKVVAPNLYIAVGISGAIQHLAGVNGSKVIVAVNTDKDAPFFEAADYGIIGDAFKVIPALNNAIKEFKVHN